MRRDHPRNRRHRDFDGGTLPGFSILEFHPEFEVEQQLITADINKFFRRLWDIVHKRNLIDQREQIKNNTSAEGVTISPTSHFVIPPADPTPQ
jgi:hypothetical protein